MVQRSDGGQVITLGNKYPSTYGKVPTHLLPAIGNIRGTINTDELRSGETGHVHAEFNI